MYECLECGANFEKPKRIPAEVYYGVDDLFDYRCGYYIEECPYCHSGKMKEFLYEEEQDRII